MESFKYVDLFATKGIEYIFIIGFLVLFVIYWRYLNKPVLKALKPAMNKIKTTLVDWFRLADDYSYHQGHTWAVAENKNTIRVGLDDFAQKLVGKADAINLPKVGTSLAQGEVGWNMDVGSKKINVLSPINGEVVELNQAVLDHPDLVNTHPYTEGWLFKIKTSKLKTNLNNLLSGKVAHAWLEETVERIGGELTDQSGLVLQDGGQMISGFAREIDPEHWEKFAGIFLLTEEK